MKLLRILVVRDLGRRPDAARHRGRCTPHDYPNKPITIITAFGPGSASDTIARVVAQPLGVALKQSVIVEARPGANGAISAMYVARAPADGYTLLMTTNSPHSAAPFLMKNIAYDPVKDFSPVTRLRQLHADAGDQSQYPGEERQGADRLRQGQSGQAHLRQRQHRGRRRRRDAQALGQARHAARALQEHAAGASTT